MTQHSYEQADAALQCVMREHNARFWQEHDGRIFIDKPKKPLPRRGGELYDSREVDLSKLQIIRERLSNDEPLQDNECLDCLKEPPDKGKKLPRGKRRD